jgi:hypothetical protein
MRACSAALEGGVLGSEETAGVVSAIFGIAVQMRMDAVFVLFWVCGGL